MGLKIGFMAGFSRNNRLTFLMALALNVYFLFIGIGNTVGEYHSFRQSQTAISTYYIAESGFAADYETPVMGEPWSIPLEFPVYQSAVALLYNMDFGISLDQSGRIVSILFFLLSLVPVYLTASLLLKDSGRALQFMALFLAAPVYIYWSRAFMIESAAFFFGITCLWLILKYNRSGLHWLLALAAVAGALCSLAKVTTWVVFSVPVLIAAFSNVMKDGKPVLNPTIIYKIAALFVIPFLTGYSWSVHAESVRNLNPLASLVFSRDTFFEWNFGDWGTKALIAAAALLVLVIIIMITKKNPFRKLIFASYASFAAGPVVFTNLYLVHDYYYYVNLIFLIITVYLLILPLMENKEKSKAGAGGTLYFAVFAVFIGFYTIVYLPVQGKNNTSISEFAGKVKSITEKNDILLIYGHDWNSLIPYYAQRRAIMDRNDFSPEKAESLKIINRENRNRIKAMIVKKDYMLNRDFIKQRVDYFGLDSLPAIVDSAYGAVYLKSRPVPGRRL